MKKRLFFSPFLLLTIIFSCNKQDAIETKQATRPDILPSNTFEKPLTSFSSLKKDQTQSNSVLSTTTANATYYGCGSLFSGSYNGTGYYKYPDNLLDLSSTPPSATVTITFNSYDVPNRFTVVNSNNITIGSTGWMGYATYPGPWGSSLSTPQTKTITFKRGSITSYKVQAETSTNSNSDGWNASISCAAPTFPDTLVLKGLTPAQKLDSAGKWHNDYQATLLQKMIDAKLNLADTAKFNPFVSPRTDTFFKPKYITPSYYGYNRYLGPEDTIIKINTAKYSSQGAVLLQKLSYLLNEYGGNFIKPYYDSLALLRSAALALPSDSEKLSVGIPIAVADSSSRFWAANGQIYANQLLANMSSNSAMLTSKPPFKVNLGSVAKADVGGAISGAVDGLALGGIAGAAAGGILGSAGSSLYDIGDQLVGYWTGWW